MHYQIMITRNGLPHEDWEAEVETPEQATAACRQQRIADGEHWPSDTYEACAAEDDDDALTHAYADAMRRCPVLHEVIAERHTLHTSVSVPAWLGIDAMPLSIGGAP